MKNWKYILFTLILAANTCAHAEVLLHELKWTLWNTTTDNFYFDGTKKPVPSPICIYGNCTPGDYIVSPMKDHHLVETSELEEVRALITAQEFTPAQRDLVQQMIDRSIEKSCKK